MGNVIMEATQINYRRDKTLKTVDQKLQELSQESAIDTDIAPVFKSTETYNPGDLVYYRNKLYKCLNTHTGAWAAGDFASTDVSTAINAAVGALDATKSDLSNLAAPFSEETAYSAGDYVEYNGLVYRCTNDHTGAWDADDFSATTIGAELSGLNSNLTNYSFTDSITTHGTWIATPIDDITDYAGKIIYGYMSNSTLGRTYEFAIPTDNMPDIQAPIWILHDESEIGYSNSIFVAKANNTNEFCVYLGLNIPDMTLYLFVH